LAEKKLIAKIKNALDTPECKVVSSEFIDKCVSKSEIVDAEEYLLKPLTDEEKKTHSPILPGKKNSKKSASKKNEDEEEDEEEEEKTKTKATGKRKRATASTKKEDEDKKKETKRSKGKKAAKDEDDDANESKKKKGKKAKKNDDDDAMDVDDEETKKDVKEEDKEDEEEDEVIVKEIRKGRTVNIKHFYFIIINISNILNLWWIVYNKLFIMVTPLFFFFKKNQRLLIQMYQIVM